MSSSKLLPGLAYGLMPALGPREYFTPSHLTGAEADVKDFLRLLAGLLWRGSAHVQSRVPC